MTVQPGFLLGKGREWFVAFKYAVKVPPFISVSDDRSGESEEALKCLERFFRAKMERGWGLLYPKQRVGHRRIANAGLGVGEREKKSMNG